MSEHKPEEGYPDETWATERLLSLLDQMPTSVKVVAGDLARGFERKGWSPPVGFGYAHDPQWLTGVAERIELAAGIVRERWRQGETQRADLQATVTQLKEQAQLFIDQREMTLTALRESEATATRLTAEYDTRINNLCDERDDALYRAEHAEVEIATLKAKNLRLQSDLEDADDALSQENEALYRQNTALRQERDDALSELTRIGPKREWQPIETAPKQADVLLLFQVGEGVRAGYWGYEFGWLSTDTQRLTGGKMQPTHWTPFPEPPTAQEPPNMPVVPLRDPTVPASADESDIRIVPLDDPTVPESLVPIPQSKVAASVRVSDLEALEGKYYKVALDAVVIPFDVWRALLTKAQS